VPRAVAIQGHLLYPVVFVAVATVSAYVHMSLGQYLRLALLGCLLQLSYTLVSAPVIARLSRPIAFWLKAPDDPERAARAWEAAISLPAHFIRRTFSRSPLGLWLGVMYALWVGYFVWQVHLAASTGLLVFVAAIVLIMYAAALRFFGVEQILRPVLRDIATHLSSDMATARGPSLQARMLMTLPAINVVTAVVADAGARHGHAHLSDLALVVLISTGVAASVSLILTVLLSNSITEPIGQLCDAARRVGAGDFDTRVPIVTSDETGELTRAFNEMVAGLQERERIRETFGTYVDRDVADHILREGTSLAGEEVELTALFLDIRNFTGYAERSPATEVVATLNRLFERIVPIVHAHGGHVDKYVGDGLLAIFGAPRRQQDHADQALAAAIEIARAVDHEFDDRLRVGIGLNSGTVVAGNLGGAGRLEFSVIGDAINVAARVESATRQTNDVILISDHTRRLLTGKRFQLEARPEVPLKGKTEAIGLFAPAVG
jgi:adenylate cyclase